MLRLVGVEVCRSAHGHEGKAEAVGRLRPFGRIIVGHGKNLAADWVAETQRFTLVGQPAGVNAVDRHAGIPRLELRLVARENKERAGAEARAVGESERDATGEGEAAEVEVVRPGV